MTQTNAQNIRLGVFVLVVLGIFAVMVFLIGSTESKFQSNDKLQAQFQSVSGLEQGADVRVGGLREGSVQKIILPTRPDGKMTVVMDISRKTRNLIKQDSVASIESEGLVGNKYVEVSFGSDSAPEVPKGGTIQSHPPLDISDLMAKTNQILDTTNAALNNLQGATANVNTITAKVNSGKGTVGELINNPAMYNAATAGAQALQADADALKHNFLLRGYFDKRGFADPAEIRKELIDKLPAAAPEKTFPFDPAKVFAKPDSAKLRDSKQLDEAGAYLEQHAAETAVIEVSAGPKGEDAKERELSQARAYAAWAYLMEHFKLDDRRVKIIGRGKTEDGPSMRVLVYGNAGG
jgi:phospholipid/cholesterol/gamma-HCH transport system substrate-binding protein